MSTNFLLCTDLDRTLLPNGTQPESPAARDLFSRLAGRPDISLVYVTGRHRALIEQAIKCYSLPQPDLVISDVGSRIYDLRSQHWEPWHKWETEISADWGGLTHTDIRDLFRDIGSLQLQEREKQNTHKLSYYVSLHENETILMENMQQRLKQHNVNASLVWSVDEPAAIGLLDVLPRGATKLHAIQFLRQQLNITLDNTIFAGDSGNDLRVLASEIPSILVANATDSVRETALAHAKNSGNNKALYCAQGDYLGMNGYYSAGILEGVAHFKPMLGDWLSGIARNKHAG